MNPAPPSNSPSDPAKSLLLLLNSIGVVAKIPTAALAQVLQQREKASSSRPALTEEQLTEIVNRKEVSTDCTEHLLTQCKWGFENENDRHRSIDTKAAALAALVSASLILLVGKAFDSEAWTKLGNLVSVNIIIVMFGISLFALLVSAALLLGAVIVREFKGPNEENVFDVELLADPECYQRSLAIQYAVMQAANGTINDKKASLLRWAQVMYAGFLAMFVVTGLVIAFSNWK